MVTLAEAAFGHHYADDCHASCLKWALLARGSARIAGVT